MKTIIYIDNYYPYSYKGETFLQNEIDFLSNKKNGIKRFIFPIYGRDIEKENIKINEKITVIEPPKYNAFIHFVWMFISLLDIQFYSEIKNLIMSNRINFNNFIKCIRFISSGLLYSHVLVKYINKNFKKGDEIILYSYWMHIHAYVASMAKKKLINKYKIKFITRCHRFDVYEYANNDYIPFRKEIFKYVDNIYSISQDAINYINNNYPLLRLNCKISMLGTFDNGERISSRGKTLKILSCSWMRPVKRIDLIYNAINNTNFPIEWIHIGDGEEYDNINCLIKSNKNKNLKCTLLGALPNNEIIEYYKKEDINIFINVSESEGIPVSIMEAMSFGKIIIATDTGGVNEIVNNQENGYLLPIQFEPIDLFKIIRLINDMSDYEYNKMCKKSREIWEQKCNAKANYLEFEEDMLENGNKC